MPESACRLRPMTVDDLDAVAQLEAQSYEFPWTYGIFRDCLRVGYRCDVLEGDGGSLAGYCILAMAAGEAHILNLCVLPSLRRQGLGRRLLQHLLRLARQADCFEVFLEVRPSNQAALALYEDNGFQQLSIRRDYYRSREGNEDAIVLAMPLK